MILELAYFIVTALVASIIGIIGTSIYFTKSITIKLNKIMANEQEFMEYLDRLDSTTNKLANNLNAVLEELQQYGLRKDREEAIFARLKNSVEVLEATGKDSENLPGGDEPEVEEPETPEEPEEPSEPENPETQQL